MSQKSVSVLLSIMLGGLCLQASADTVMVKYRGMLDLANLQCEWVTRSSLIRRLCYDKATQYVVVSLNGTYYHYCGVTPAIVSAWRSAESMGQYFNAAIKGRYDCRLSPPPPYR